MQFGDGEQGWAVPYRDWRGAVREVLANYDEPRVLHHGKFDAGFLIKDGLPFPWEKVHDTMMMCHLANNVGPKGLKPASALYVDPMARAGEKQLRAEMVKNRWGYDTVPVDLPAYWGYAAMDTVLTARLAEVLWPRVQPFREAYDLELACQRVLTYMELRGVRLDVAYCEQNALALEQQLGEIYERLGALNPAANKQVVDALVAQGHKLTKRTEKGQLAVDDEVLTGLAEAGVQLAADVLEARSLSKLHSGYFENFLRHRAGDMLHPHINQLAARTSRMSVTDPPLQTVPRKALVRDAFIAREGNKLVLVDYDNEELRVAAHFSGDEALIDAFENNRDLHSETALRMYGEGFVREQRTTAKNSMYAWAYGAGIERFMDASHISHAEASAVLASLVAQYPGMATAMQRATNAVRSRAAGSDFGYVELIDGRRIHVPADKPYVGFNAVMQGSCAVVLKRALVDLDLAGLGDLIVLPVHDEVVFDVPQEDVEEAVPEIKRIMTREDFRVPLTVGAKIVDRWGEPYREE